LADARHDLPAAAAAFVAITTVVPSAIAMLVPALCSTHSDHVFLLAALALCGGKRGANG
jgi:hypothetical protein